MKRIIVKLALAVTTDHEDVWDYAYKVAMSLANEINEQTQDAFDARADCDVEDVEEVQSR